MNQPLLNQQMPAPAAMPATGAQPAAFNPETLELRDIHLPDPISWWPVAPGWWLLLAGLILFVAAILVARKIYQSKQLGRDISNELETIKKQFRQSNNKVALAKALSILLRRASISYYPEKDIAGLIGKDWLAWLDESGPAANNSTSAADKKFQSATGEVLLSAPYLPDDAELDFDAQALLKLCEAWLRAPHKNKSRSTRRRAMHLRGKAS